MIRTLHHQIIHEMLPTLDQYRWDRQKGLAVLVVETVARDVFYFKYYKADRTWDWDLIAVVQLNDKGEDK
jgi:hypothetical protein